MWVFFGKGGFYSEEIVMIILNILNNRILQEGLDDISKYFD